MDVLKIMIHLVNFAVMSLKKIFPIYLSRLQLKFFMLLLLKLIGTIFKTLLKNYALMLIQHSLTLSTMEGIIDFQSPSRLEMVLQRSWDVSSSDPRFDPEGQYL